MLIRLFVLVGTAVGYVIAILYCVVVAPFAYIAYVIADFPLRMILAGGSDVGLLMVNGSVDSEAEVMIQKVVSEHRVTLRNILVAVPSLMLSIVLDSRALI